MNRRFLRLVLVTALALGAAEEASAEDDYVIEHRGWNGLSMFAGLSRGLGMDVVARSSIEWDALNPDDIVLVLYPTKHLEPNHLVAFIRNGGRVLLADDFGRADDAIERLSMLRHHGVGVGAASRYDDLSYAPIAKPVALAHPLARGVDELTTNHPSVLSNVSGYETVFAFSDGEAVVVSGDIGYGRFVVLADPSVLINRMLEFEGNFNFARNLIHYLARTPGSGRVVILTGDFYLRGVPSQVYSDSDEGSSASQSLAGFNRFLEELNDYFLTESSLRVIAVLVALVIVALALSAIPLRSRTDVSGNWVRVRAEEEANSGFQAIVSQFDQGRRRVNFELPAAILRDEVIRRLSEITGLADPMDETQRPTLYRRLGETCGSAAASALGPLENALRTLPPSAQAAANWQPIFVSKREFERLVTQSDQLYRSLVAQKHGS